MKGFKKKGIPALVVLVLLALVIGSSGVVIASDRTNTQVDSGQAADMRSRKDEQADSGGQVRERWAALLHRMTSTVEYFTTPLRSDRDPGQQTSEDDVREQGSVVTYAPSSKISQVADTNKGPSTNMSGGGGPIHEDQVQGVQTDARFHEVASGGGTPTDMQMFEVEAIHTIWAEQLRIPT